MNERRKGEIALILAKDQMSRESVRFSDVKRELGNLAKKTGIPFPELKEFMKILLGELFVETFHE